MANVKTSALISDISGKVGGNIFARNRSGLCVRAFAKPVNPNSALQQAVRAAVANLSNEWSQTLTTAQQTAWNLYADSVTVKNKLGEDMNLSGYNMFVRSNAILDQNGLDLVLDGPTVYELPEQDPTFAISISEATGLITVTFEDAAEWCDEDEAHMVVYMGSPQNPQRNFFAGPWKYAGKIDGDGSTPPTTGATLSAPFVPTEGQKIWAYARILRADGRMSEPFRGSCFCGA